MAVSLTSFSGSRTEMSILEINQNLRSQLEKVKQDFRDLTEKFLTSKATVYSLANQLQKYNCEEYKELIEFVLEEGVPFEEGELAEKMRSAARLGKYDPLIQAQAQELTHLRQKIQEGKGACYLFTQHARNTVKSFESLLRSTDIAYYQRQRFCELLTQGSQLAERLASQLTTEDHQDREGEDGQEPLAPSFSRGLQAEEENEVQEDSLDEMYLTHSSYQDSHQPPNTNAFACDGQEASSAVDVAETATEGSSGLSVEEVHTNSQAVSQENGASSKASENRKDENDGSFTRLKLMPAPPDPPSAGTLGTRTARSGGEAEHPLGSRGGSARFLAYTP
ncbi:NBPF family member NBPF6-like protein [Camelus bactrianus]|uniref:NBPF family member NBPF6-like protein n=1 Tax=Camelus bactrianus TaxID=9837 RepID=A0A9W3F7K8_CAMBA|nr:neuroblastoma breakpoint family member 6-like protein [Camelus bactrianus]